MDSPEISELGNGLRVVSFAMPHLETVSLGVWVGVGARHEADGEHGISHFLEHMAFKGTATRSAFDIAEEIEAVGGELNAATSLESTAYYARVLKDDAGLALGILADILQNSLFAEEEIEREREVVQQEIAGISDSPEELGYDYLQEVAFPDQAVGRSIIGTRQSVAKIDGPGLKNFLERRYKAPGMVLAAAGAVEHQQLVRHAEALFNGLNSGEVRQAESASYVGGVKSSDRTFEQCHLLLGFDSPSYRDEDYFTAQVFSGILGGGMSSRLFQEVREKRGLCYAVYSSAWGLVDGGLFTIHAATGSEQMPALSEVVSRELGRLCETPVPAREISRAKAQLKAGLMMGLESSSARAEQMARHLMGHGRIIPASELIDRMEAVSSEGLRQFAVRLVEQKQPAVAVVGAGSSSQGFADDAQRFVQSLVG